MQAGATLVHCMWVNFISKNLQKKPRVTFANQSWKPLFLLEFVRLTWVILHAK